jgi:kynureninase
VLVVKEKKKDLKNEIESIRQEFPVLKECTYLISNSLGAVPRKVCDGLERFYSLWAGQGVGAWKTEWWDLSRMIGDKLASFIGAGPNEVTMLTNATQCHWAALSTKFTLKRNKRNKIIMTEYDFPSILYAVSKIAKFTGWEVKIIPGNGMDPGIDVERIIENIDDRTLFVATSHVYFKSAFIQDITAITSQARRVGAYSLIDGYHAPGVIPVDVKKLKADFYVGGCLKWLCGGPGNAFLYVDPELASACEPSLTGWMAHALPFDFSNDLNFSQGAYKFMSGTPPVACLYSVEPGLDIIRKVGIEAIREKSKHQTEEIIKKACEMDFKVYSSEKSDQRGGAVSLGLPHAFQVSQALEQKNIRVDFRKGDKSVPDVIRVGPHFYTRDEEIEILFENIRFIFKSGAYKKFPDITTHIT